CNSLDRLPICRPWRDWYLLFVVSTNMPSLAGVEPAIHLSVYQYAVPGGTGTFYSSCLPICRPWWDWSLQLICPSTNMPSLAGLVPAINRSSTNMPSLAGLEPVFYLTF